MKHLIITEALGFCGRKGAGGTRLKCRRTQITTVALLLSGCSLDCTAGQRSFPVVLGICKKPLNTAKLLDIILINLERNKKKEAIPDLLNTEKVLDLFIH